MNASRAATALAWLALLLTAIFVAFAIGRQLHAELLAFPVMMLAAAQLFWFPSSRSQK